MKNTKLKTKLAKLPYELIIKISSFQDSKNKLNFSFTCKDTIDSFIHYFNNAKYYDDKNDTPNPYSIHLAFALSKPNDFVKWYEKFRNKSYKENQDSCRNELNRKQYEVIQNVYNRLTSNLGYVGPIITNRELKESGANFAGTNLREADLSGLDLSDIDFSCADMEDVKLKETILTNAKFNNANMEDADLTQSTAETTDFSGANMKETILKLANCKKANFTKTNLKDSDLTNMTLDDAIFENTNLEDADATDVDFNKAKTTKGTKLSTISRNYFRHLWT